MQLAQYGMVRFVKHGTIRLLLVAVELGNTSQEN